MSEENKDLARRSWEILVNEQNPDAIDELYTLISFGTNPIKTSRALSKLGSSSTRTYPPFLTCTSVSRT